MKKLGFEELGERILLAWGGDGGNPEECTFCDTNQDGIVSAVGDVLPLINRANLEGFGETHRLDFGDVDFDGWFTPRDILCVINFLNFVPDNATIIRVNVTSSDTYGLSPEVSRTALEQAFSWYEDFNVRFQFVEEAADLIIGTDTVHVGGGLHAGGVFWFPNIIVIHDGWIPGGTHSCTRAACHVGFYLQVFSAKSFEKTIVHEVGHYLGLGHSSNIGCIMHSHAAADYFCDEEISYFETIFPR